MWLLAALLLLGTDSVAEATRRQPSEGSCGLVGVKPTDQYGDGRQRTRGPWVTQELPVWLQD